MAVNRQRAGLLASDRAVQEVGLSELSSSGSALAAVIAGYFAAAGHSPGVLLAPVTLLVAGVGQSGRAFDGRSVQPGRGAKRPRGLLPGVEIPAASRVALSSSVAAIAVAAAYEGGLSLSPLVRAGVQAAERAGASARAAVLTRVAAVGPAAISEPAFVQPLLRVASPSQGGLLTPTDFSAPTAPRPRLDRSFRAPPRARRADRAR
jgi:gamma-glutamyltranspeptidase/glutathione hydrolase